MKNLFLPVPETCVITQSWEQHKQRAIKNGWGWKPGMRSPYYFPGVDFAPVWAQRFVDVPIFATLDGVVKVAGPDSQGVTMGYGMHIRIQHADGSQSIYGHLELDGVHVKAGDKVTRGQRIGTMGNTGNSTGKHLHFELRNPAGVPVDPMPLIGDGQEPEPEPEPAPEPEQPVVDGKEPESFPKLPQARVTAEPFLYVRAAPDVSASSVARVDTGQQVSVIGMVKQGSDVWLQIGHNQYIAKVHKGQQLAAWV